MTNTNPTFYPTEVQTSPQKPSPLQKNINKFHKQLNEQLSETILCKKNELIKKSKQLYDNIQKIKQQSQKYRNKIYHQQKQFEENVEKYIKYDVRKWKDYDLYFRNYFKVLEDNVHHHRRQNQGYRSKITEKSLLLKTMLKHQINSIVLQPLLKTQHLTTKQSTIQLSYSKSLRERIKTQSSLPSLKPYNKVQRFKTIESENDVGQKPQRKAYSYMQSIGTLKEKQNSLFPLLINMFNWYKETDVDYENNWFAKVVLQKRNFNKLIQYLQKKSITRRIVRKK